MKNKLTILAYISFIFISIMFTIPGVVLIEMSQRFGVDTYKIGYALTFFTIATSSSAFFSGYMLKKIERQENQYNIFLV